MHMNSGGITMIIHTPTIEEYIMIVDELLKQDIIWGTGSSSVNEKFWRRYEHETHIVIRSNKYLSYCGIEFINSNNLKITEVYQFLCLSEHNYFKKKYGLK